MNWCLQRIPFRNIKALIALASLISLGLIFTLYYFKWFVVPFQKHDTRKACPPNANREQFKTLLSRWHFLAESHAIDYVIAMGSLLGQYRYNEPIPWDGDVDILVDQTYFKVLKRFAQKRNFKQGHDNDFHLVVHPEFETKLENDRQRWNCEGKKVPEQEDSCSFIQPLGRFIYGYNHLDIFHFTHVDKMINDPDIGKRYNRTDFYPFVKCNFMDMLTWCPNDVRKVLEKRYGSLEAELVCKNGEWKQKPH